MPVTPVQSISFAGSSVVSIFLYKKAPNRNQEGVCVYVCLCDSCGGGKMEEMGSGGGKRQQERRHRFQQHSKKYKQQQH